MRLASEDVIISAPMSYVGSAQRIIRLRRRAPAGSKLVAITVLAVLLIVMVWALVTVWYLTWGILLVPYRVLRRGARKRKVETLRHRELLGTIQGSAAASSAAIVAARVPPPTPLDELVSDADREQAIAMLREHLLAGRLQPAEFEDRLAMANRARTRGDLQVVHAHLPVASL